MKTKKQIKQALLKIIHFKWSSDLPPHVGITNETEVVKKTLEWVLDEDNEDDN